MRPKKKAAPPKTRAARTYLGGLELMVMLGVVKLNGKAYGSAIAKLVGKRTGVKTHIGAVYTSLVRLEEKKLIRSSVTEAKPRRGGRSQRIYATTDKGKAMVARSVNGIKKLAA